MLALLELALSRPEFRERIPNAHLVVGPGGEPWEGVGSPPVREFERKESRKGSAILARRGSGPEVVMSEQI